MKQKRQIGSWSNTLVLLHQLYCFAYSKRIQTTKKQRHFSLLEIVTHAILLMRQNVLFTIFEHEMLDEPVKRNVLWKTNFLSIFPKCLFTWRIGREKRREREKLNDILSTTHAMQQIRQLHFVRPKERERKNKLYVVVPLASFSFYLSLVNCN